MNFYDQLQQTITNGPTNRSVTENGAVGYKTTGKKLLDLNFTVSSLRSASDSEIEMKFAEALGEDFNTAVVWLFFARDCKQGLGERRLFRVCMEYLAREFPDKVRKLLPLIAEYGRWDDLWCLLCTRLKDDVVNLIRNQLGKDMQNMKNGKSVSLIAKWLKSENTSSYDSRRLAAIIRTALNITPR